MNRFIVLVLALMTLSGALASRASAAPDTPTITTLSNRADLISGGDALVEIALPPNVATSSVRVEVDGRDVTAAFAVRPNGRLMGLLTGLVVGENVVTASASGVPTARLTITNHPIGGPVFSGPQVQPWICRTQENGFGPPADAQCNVSPRFSFFYRSSDPTRTGFQPYDPANPPGDVARTTTDQGQTVPYVVRVETGVINRGWYRIAVLFDPTQPWEPWAPQRGWNGKLSYGFGGGSTPSHYQHNPPATNPILNISPGILDDMALSRGFAVAGASLNVFGQNNNDVVSAETLMMVKERFIERYGEIRYTMGTGCSGGSIQQHLIANAYPGLLDGIQPSCSYPDSKTTGNESVDCSLMLRYFRNTSPHLWPAEQQQAAATGHASISTCTAWVDVFGFDRNADPRQGCGGDDTEPWIYDPDTNPDGTRCTSHDYQIAVWGRREQDGFARSTYDNVGVQYGLVALQSGEILPEQFVDLNEKVGGRDIDYNWIPQRTEGDAEAQPIAYRSGRVNDARRLDLVPIIDLRGSSNFEIHTDFNSYALRQRLLGAHGHADNHVIFTADTPLALPPGVILESFLLMDRWLAAIETDTSADPRETKVVRHKPTQAVDACYVGEEKITDQAKCRALFPWFGSTRIAAGGPLSNHLLQCQLTPLSRRDYTVVFTDEQWARLQAVFARGVCDWRQPAVGEQPSEPWVTFADGPGGIPLGPAPVSTSGGMK